MRQPRVPVPDGWRRCPQCWVPQPLEAFSGRQMCDGCREYRRNGYVPLGRSPALDAGTELRVMWKRYSQVAKLGGIPCSTTTGYTCPTSCSMRGNGCYAEFGHGGQGWRSLSEGRGIPWAEFLGEVAQLPAGQLWRHNLAGDLPGRGDDIDHDALAQLVTHNQLSRARGFTFTHKPMTTGAARAAVRTANNLGFTVNLSADGVAQADQLLELRVGPVVAVLPTDAPAEFRTPAGQRVIVCPSQRKTEVTCKSCQLCADPGREAVIGFRAHGQMKKAISLRVLR